jgi:hypothetical protein
MKTAQFIDALAADATLSEPGLRTRFFVALAIGSAVSAALFFAVIGPRADIAVAAHTVRFGLKFLDTLALTFPSALLCLHLLRPDARPGTLALLFGAPVLLLCIAVGVELYVVPADQWTARIVGSNALHCLTIIPVVAMPPLMALLYSMRAGAPQNPTLAGALAGAAAAGIAATLYASNCTDDSPLFVASWYPLATLIVVVVGSAVGNRLLRW